MYVFDSPIVQKFSTIGEVIRNKNVNLRLVFSQFMILKSDVNAITLLIIVGSL
jgi:UV DNA damage repair endonuclease